MTRQGETTGVGCLPASACLARLHRLRRQGDIPVSRTPTREWLGFQRQGAMLL